jgi:hypothetical protein
LPTNKVPPLKVDPPLKVFAPLSVNAPLPLFTKAGPTPVPVITPLYVVVVEPLTVNVDVCKFTAPPPAKLPIVSLAANFNVPGDVTTTAPESRIADPTLSVRVPPFTVVKPLNVFAPPSVNSPAPDFVNANAPETTPVAATSLNVVNVKSEVSTPAPVNVSFPVFTASPIDTKPPNS